MFCSMRLKPRCAYLGFVLEAEYTMPGLSYQSARKLVWTNQLQVSCRPELIFPSAGLLLLFWGQRCVHIVVLSTAPWQKIVIQWILWGVWSISLKIVTEILKAGLLFSSSFGVQSSQWHGLPLSLVICAIGLSFMSVKSLRFLKNILTKGYLKIVETTENFKTLQEKDLKIFSNYQDWCHRTYKKILMPSRRKKTLKHKPWYWVSTILKGNAVSSVFVFPGHSSSLIPPWSPSKIIVL